MLSPRGALDYRAHLNLLMSVCVAWFGTGLLPFSLDNAILGLIALQRPRLYLAFEWGYYALWTSTAFLALSVLTSVIYICAARTRGRETRQQLPLYPPIGHRESLFLVLGERHHA